MDTQELIARCGENNARIMMQRAETHQAGLELMCVPDLSRRPHVVGPMRGEITPVTPPTPSSELPVFFARMRQIEEEFMSGVRKRPYTDTFEV